MQNMKHATAIKHTWRSCQFPQSAPSSFLEAWRTRSKREDQIPVSDQIPVYTDQIPVYF